LRFEKKVARLRVQEEGVFHSQLASPAQEVDGKDWTFRIDFKGGGLSKKENLERQEKREKKWGLL